MPETIVVANEAEMAELGKRLAPKLGPQDTVLLYGELGAGKTTLVRAIVSNLGHPGTVRSPTFNLIQLYPTTPPILHADLYRVKSAEYIGLEDYLDHRLCLIEWPDRLKSLVEEEACWRITIEFLEDGRTVEIKEPVHIDERKIKT